MKRRVAALVMLAALAACAGDEAPLVKESAVPSQQRDPELRTESASAGPSRPSTAVAPPRGVTDLGREAEKEEEEIRKREKLRALDAPQR